MVIEQVNPPTSGMTLVPAQLFVGPQEPTTAHVQILLQKLFCTHGACNVCRNCRQIAEHQHHSIMWLYPEKQYTLAQFDAVFDIIALAREPGEQFFFIIQKADFLPIACANRLLKSLEEPPAGYHFMLLAERPNHILPTIKSRCATHIITGSYDSLLHEQLVSWFTKKTPAINPLAFLKYLDQEQVSEQETLELLDTILTHWTNRYKQATRENNTQEMRDTQKVIAILKDAYHHLPMPGSSKLFWKNLFLQFVSL